MGRYLWLFLAASFLAASCGSGSQQPEGLDNAPMVVIPDSLPLIESIPTPQTLAGYSWTTGERTITETNCGDACSEISWQWFVLSQAPNATLPDSVNAFNWYYITAIPGAREKDLDSIAAAFFKEARKDVAPDGADFIGWGEEDRVWPVAATAQTFTVGGYVSFYSGGPHPNGASHMENFEVATGRRLTLADVVAQPFNIFKVGEQVFRKQKGIDPSATLAEGGFSFKEDVFYLPETFGVLPEGLLFVYAPYEIASYAEGEQYLLIPYSVIANELRPEYQYLAK